jgi:hypothetical protein
LHHLKPLFYFSCEPLLVTLLCYVVSKALFLERGHTPELVVEASQLVPGTEVMQKLFVSEQRLPGSCVHPQIFGLHQGQVWVGMLCLQETSELPSDCLLDVKD